MAGSIREHRPGVWELRAYSGRDSAGRMRHQHATFATFATFEGTKRSAGRQLARLVTEQENHPARVPVHEERAWGPATTSNDAIEGWRHNGWPDLSPNTV